MQVVCLTSITYLTYVKFKMCLSALLNQGQRQQQSQEEKPGITKTTRQLSLQHKCYKKEQIIKRMVMTFQKSQEQLSQGGEQGLRINRHFNIGFHSILKKAEGKFASYFISCHSSNLLPHSRKITVHYLAALLIDLRLIILHYCIFDY